MTTVHAQARKNTYVPSLTGLLVRKWRESQGFTQESLGLRMDPPSGRNWIHDIEQKGNSPNERTMLKLARALDVPGDDDQQRLMNFFAGPLLAQAWAAERIAEAVVEQLGRVAPAPSRPRAHKKGR